MRGEDDRKDKKIRVVVGEDSSLMRRIIVETLSSDEEIEVVASCSNGREVLEEIVQKRPHCVTLDLKMPCMDGLETLGYIMSEWPTPVVIISAHTKEGAETTLKCLEHGAVDFIPKTQDGKFFCQEELISKVKSASSVDISKMKYIPPDCSFRHVVASFATDKAYCVVLIGASTGGPQALMEVVPRLPDGIPASIVVAQHMPPNFTSYLADRLNERSALPVREACEGDPLLPGKVYIAPGGMHILVRNSVNGPLVMLLERNSRYRSACPSLDFAMTSFAHLFRENLLAVVMTGMGKDGASGSIAVKRSGGRVICQDEESSLIFGMPQAVIETGSVKETVPLESIPQTIVENVNQIISRKMSYEN
jgi:two-component system chemotaxis response regulator CheB